MVFHWSLSDSKSPQVSRTLLSILAVLINAVVWMVSTRPPTSKSSSPFSNPLVTVPNAPITIGIIVTCIFHSFFSSLPRSRYISFFSHSFSFILWSAGTCGFFTPVFANCLSLESEWQQFFLIILCFLADLNNAVVWMVSARLPSFNSFSLLTKPLGIVPSSRITIGITVTIMFHSFSSSRVRSKNLSLFPCFLIFSQ